MLNYIIATYDANLLEYSLYIQLLNLYSVVMNGQTSNLSQITIVCPPSKNNSHPNYYQKDFFQNLFDKTSIKLVYMDYVGDNTNASYDQWIQGYLAYPNFDYFIFIEDDYCIHPKIHDFDSVLVNIYEEKIKNTKDGTGYLCSLACALGGMEYHASVSNGIVNKKTMEKLGLDVLKKFYAYNITCAQIKFSYLFTDNGVDILSLDKDFISWFWNSSSRKLYHLSEDDPKESLFIPIQYLFSQYFKNTPIFIPPLNDAQIKKRDLINGIVETSVANNDETKSAPKGKYINRNRGRGMLFRHNYK